MVAQFKANFPTNRLPPFTFHFQSLIKQNGGQMLLGPEIWVYPVSPKPFQTKTTPPAPLTRGPYSQEPGRLPQKATATVIITMAVLFNSVFSLTPIIIKPTYFILGGGTGLPTFGGGWSFLCLIGGGGGGVGREGFWLSLIRITFYLKQLNWPQ